MKNNMNNNNASMNKAQQGMINNPYIQNQGFDQANQGFQSNPYINQNMAQNTQNQNNSFNSNDFIKGALIGAGITFLLTNKTTQQAIFNGFAKASDMFNMGMEEIKERIEDAKAQMEASGEN